MSKESDQDTPDDIGLFRREMRDARPINRDMRAPEYKAKPRPRARFTRADEDAVLLETLDFDIDDFEANAGDALRFSRPSVGRRTMRKLSRGNYSVQNEIDLHGMTVAEARIALRDFLAECSRRNITCVRVVHGKGLGSGNRGPILKSKVNSWLKRWKEVLAFVSTRQVHGGTGALYVLLRKD